MSHQCTALKKRPPHDQCMNRIANPRQKYCDDHKDPSSRYQGPSSPQSTRTLSYPSQASGNRRRPSYPVSAHPAQPQYEVPPQTAQPVRRPSLSEIPEIHFARLKKAAEIADEIVTEGWKKAASTRISSVLNNEVMDELWKRARNRHKRSVLCKFLAKEARFLLDTQGQFRNAVAATADRVLKCFRRPVIERLIAERLAHHIPLPGNEQIAALAWALQNWGILICMVEGRHPSTCRCLQDLSENETSDRVREIVQGGLNQLVSRN